MKFKHGDVLEIPLQHNFGYAYGQLLLFKEIILVVYDLFSKESLIKKGEEELFLKATPLWNPFILRTLPRERGKEKWAIVSSLKPFFNIPPDFKRDGLDITGLLEIISEGNLSNGTFFSEYENAKHLPLWGHCHPDLIVNVLTMFWIEKNGLGIYDYYDSTDTNFLITMAKGFKESVVNEHFESIPEEIRYRTQGKLINVEEYKKNYMNPPE